MAEQQKPFYLQGNFAPYLQEDSEQICTVVQGKIPDDLCGTLFRNGPNPHYPNINNHWFEGDGMIHAIHIDQEKVFYQNRWVRTQRFELEQRTGRGLFSGFGMNNDPLAEGVAGSTANTNVVYHGGRLLALEETTPAVEIKTDNLETLGTVDWQGKVPTMSAHPHMDHQTGQMFCHDYSFFNNIVSCYSWDKTGALQDHYQIEAPYSSMMHDFAITQNYIIYPLMPLTADLARAKKGGPFLMWEPECGTHFAVGSKHDSDDVTWFKLPAFYVFHFMNAYEEGDCIVIDGMKAGKPFSFPDQEGKISDSDDPDGVTYFTRWVLDRKSGSVQQTQLDDMEAEFPRFDERFTGLPYKHGYAVGRSEGATYFDHIIHYNLASKKTDHLYLGQGRFAMEPNFVPKAEDSAEGEGYLLVLVYDAGQDNSELLILDAIDINREPLAVIAMPHRVPFGFHGNWVSAMARCG